MNVRRVAPGPVLLLDRTAVVSLLTLDDCIDAVESAFADHARGRSLASQLMHVDADGGEFHIKAGGLRCARTYFACKINGGFFGNCSKLGLPNILGLVLLADGTTGLPLAVMESGFLTMLRTGAATAVAAKYLARPGSRTALICGAGVQAEIQLRSLARVLPIERAFIWSRSDPTGFARRVADDLHMDVCPAPDLKAAALQSDVIVTCTPAKRWFLGRQHVRPGAFVAAIGADSPEKQEVEPELLAQASLVCDLTEQCARVGDLHHAIQAGLMQSDGVRGELGAVIAGLAPKRLRDDEIFVFDSTGTALQDVAAAASVYEKAISRGKGQTFAFWR
jgi:alanine dehydrogenase